MTEAEWKLGGGHGAEKIPAFFEASGRSEPGKSKRRRLRAAIFDRN